MTMNSAPIFGLVLLFTIYLQASPVTRDQRLAKYVELSANTPQLLTGFPGWNFGDDDDDKVEFYLLTKDTVDSPVLAMVDDEGELFSGAFDASKETKVVIHGWLDNLASEYAKTMISAYLPENDVNLIFVQWSQADTIFYFYSASKVSTVGQITATLLERLVTESGLQLSSVHIVGHSLGSHVAAVVGYSVESGTIKKITGLDPALPLFTIGGDDTLSDRAADFVEVVHSCGNVLGIFTAIGHADFYPNQGIPFQPGCSFNIACSHDRSYVYYAEAIANATSFQATECADFDTYDSQGCDDNNKIFMSENTDPSARGKFYFETAASTPFGLGAE